MPLENIPSTPSTDQVLVEEFSMSDTPTNSLDQGPHSKDFDLGDEAFSQSATEIPNSNKSGTPGILNVQHSKQTLPYKKDITKSKILQRQTTLVNLPKNSQKVQNNTPLNSSHITSKDDIMATKHTEFPQEPLIFPDDKNTPSPYPNWMIPKPREVKQTVPIPKNFVELQAFKALNLEDPNIHAKRYKTLDNRISAKSIFAPVVQPIDYNNMSDGSFSHKRFLLPDLIDPFGYRKLVVDCYPRDSFSHVWKMANILEKRRDLILQPSPIEISFIFGVITRLTEAFLTLSNLVQVSMNDKALKLLDSPTKREQFRRTLIIAMNACAQEIYSLQPLLSKSPSERIRPAFQEKLLNFANSRIEAAPILDVDRMIFTPDPYRGDDFTNPPLTYRKAMELSRKQYRTGARKRKRSRDKYSSNNKRRSTRKSSRQGPRHKNSRRNSKGRNTKKNGRENNSQNISNGAQTVHAPKGKNITNNSSSKNDS